MVTRWISRGQRSYLAQSDRTAMPPHPRACSLLWPLRLRPTSPGTCVYLYLLGLGSSASGRFYLGHMENECSTSLCVCVILFDLQCCNLLTFPKLANFLYECSVLISPEKSDRSGKDQSIYAHVARAKWWPLSAEGACVLTGFVAHLWSLNMRP